MDANSKPKEHPSDVYSAHTHFISRIFNINNDYIVELSNLNPIYRVKISKELADKIIDSWNQSIAVMLLFNGGTVVDDNLIINSKCSLEFEELDQASFL